MVALEQRGKLSSAKDHLGIYDIICRLYNILNLKINLLETVLAAAALAGPDQVILQALYHPLGEGSLLLP